MKIFEVKTKRTRLEFSGWHLRPYILLYVCVHVCIVSTDVSTNKDIVCGSMLHMHVRA